jgi:hypothetical protein
VPIENNENNGAQQHQGDGVWNSFGTAPEHIRVTSFPKYFRMM